VRIRYNSLEASGEDASPERASRAEGVFSGSSAVSAAPPTPSLFSPFAQECVFASPSFPDTYSLFQKEYSRNPQQFKSFIHSFAKHPGVTLTPSSEAPLPRPSKDLLKPSLEETTIPFRIKFFAHPNPLTFMESNSYKKQRRGAPNSRCILPLPPNTQELLQLHYFHAPTHSCVHGGGGGTPRLPAYSELRGASSHKLSTVNLFSTTHHSLPTTHFLPLETPTPNGASLSMYAQATRKKGPAAREPR